MSIPRFGHHLMVAVAVAAVASVACGYPPRRPAAFAAPAATHRHADGALIAHPAHGSTDAHRYATFLLGEIPALLDGIRCRCCRFTLAKCLRGACADLCPMCLILAREAYALHLRGLPDDEVVKTVRALPVDD
ncbi:MAG: hypothetical protein HYV09_35200 [Deltaproteobacteria bacterium]|nr:hypothetical protein [Deltaproteobacteria bacterium]